MTAKLTFTAAKFSFGSEQVKLEELGRSAWRPLASNLSGKSLLGDQKSIIKATAPLEQEL